MTKQSRTIAILWRGDRDARDGASAQSSRLRQIFEAIEATGVRAEPAVFAEEFADEVSAQLSSADGVLVWVDPISAGRNRAVLDSLLRDLASKGIWVSAHPDVILKMGTKEVLVRTKNLGWGTDTHLYRSSAELRRDFPERLAKDGPRVVKQNRGNGGQGVWRVEQARDRSDSNHEVVRVLHAQRGSTEETMRLADFLARCDAYFADDGMVVDQPFQRRLGDGMIRCYCSAGAVVGFGHQLIKALLPIPPQLIGTEAAQPGPRIMHGPSAPAFQTLRRKMESEWIPGMQRILAIATDELPAIWDADFLYGPKDEQGRDSYVLCEINVSSCFPLPDEAPAAIAQWVTARSAQA